MQTETTRLLLRPIALSDAAAVFKYRSDKVANQYQGWIPESLDEVESFIEKSTKEFNLPESWFQLVIVEKDSSKLVGDIGIHFVGDDNQQVELGCTLNTQFQQKGYATEAMSGVIDFLFTKLKKHRIYTSIDPRNTSSIKLVERLGFRKEAHFVKSLFFKGEWVDDIVYALLREE